VKERERENRGGKRMKGEGVERGMNKGEAIR
jgi:hypothetical protein